MDVKNFFHKILSGNKGTTVPATVKENFALKFNHPINTEWQKTGEQFEAVFYKDDLEHIARYSPDGKLTCLKVNLPLEGLPPMIETTAKKHGELMNAIFIECEESRKYELIVRDSELIRYFLLVNQDGEVAEKEKL
ncbi:hypothetical protein [Mangrovibacterium sp.]|uniref:hypothetical protein n=1 Tax=Mangrovibacterium sp. TaxID=1961364 RepID=UPI0035679E7D